VGWQEIGAHRPGRHGSLPSRLAAPDSESAQAGRLEEAELVRP
jgi:hypothetical protein